MNVYICGCCKKDYSKNEDRNRIMKKVILAGYANLLCRTCRIMLEEDVKVIARAYLNKN